MRRPNNLSIDISVANAGNDHGLGHGFGNDRDNENALNSTYRAEGLSIGRNYLRFEGTMISSSSSLSIENLVIEGTIGRGTSGIVKRARLKKRSDNHDSYDGRDGNSHADLGPQNDGGLKTKSEYTAKVEGDGESFPEESPSGIQNTRYALKIFPLHLQANQNGFIPLSQNSEEVKKHSSMLIQEIKMMCQLQCECLVHFYGAYYDPGVSVTMVLEYMHLGSLADFLRFGDESGRGKGLEVEGLSDETEIKFEKKHVRLTEKALAAIAYQMLWGLAYLHCENILHRDIKPENVLLNPLGQVKLSDLGISGTTASSKIARRMDMSMGTGIDMEASGSGLNHTVVGTSKYFSPERVIDKAYGPPADIWSFGLVIVECATSGWNPFFNETEDDNDCDEGESVEGSGTQNLTRSRRRTHRRSLCSIVELAMVLDDFCIDDVLEKLIKFDKVGAIDINWEAELKRSNGIGEMLKWSLQRLPEKRIPARLLLESPWFQRWGIHGVETAQIAMRTFLDSLSPES